MKTQGKGGRTCMKHLLSSEGIAALRLTAQAAPLLAFDFDGTLAPIVAHPDQARVPPGLAQRLQRLNQHLPVVIITGRSRAEVQTRLPFTPTQIIGNHGAEDAGGRMDEAAVTALEEMRQRLQGAQGSLARAGVTVEDKGASIALHYRQARDADAARHAIDEVTAALSPSLHAFAGKCVHNVVAAAAADKAAVLESVVAQYGRRAAFYAGDDANDEPVFERAPPSWLTVRVGPELRGSSARFFLHGPAEMPRVLDLLLETLTVESGGRGNRLYGRS